MPRRAREHEEVAKEASWNAEVLGDRFSLSVYSTRPGPSVLEASPRCLGGCVHRHDALGCATVLTSSNLLIGHPNVQSLTSSHLEFLSEMTS